MVLVKNEIKIDLPLEKCFEFLANPETIPLWNYYVKDVQKISEEDGIIGSCFHQIRKHDDQYFEISRLEKNTLIELVTLPGSNIKFKRCFYLSDHEGETLIIDHFELDTGLPQFVQKITKTRIRKAVNSNLQKLKQLLETGQTTLQDGRISTIGI